MKKMIILCTVIALLFSMTCISASAEETEETEKSVFPYGDSRDVPNSFMERIPDIDRRTGEETVTVLRYYVRGVGNIYNYNNMEEAFANYKKSDFFMNVTKSGKAYYHSIDSDGDYRGGDDEISTPPAAIREYQTQEALKAISPDIVVENMYYIHSSEWDGAGIYYKTNMGNYVFYDDFRSSRIFSEEAFFAYIKAWQQEVWEKFENAGDMGLASPKLDSLDLSAYDYKSPNFNPNAPFPGTKNTEIWLWVGIGAGVLLLAGGAAFYFIKRKKATVAE